MTTVAEEERLFFVGIDWATEAHRVCVLRPDRTVERDVEVKHEGPAIRAFVDSLDKLAGGQPHRVGVSIEMPRGSIVETLIERGFAVYAINPKQLDRFRDRHTMAGAKDDRRDAFVLADSLRTDVHLFRKLDIDKPVVIELRELLRVDQDLGEDWNRTTNRVREQLHRYYPQLLAVCPAADEAWLWALFELAPTPEQGAKLTEKRVAKVLTDHHIRRIKAADVIEKLRVAPLTVAPGTAVAGKTHVSLAIERLRLTARQRSDVHKRIDAVVEELSEGQEREHRDVRIILSLPGVGTKVAATMLAEASTALANRDYQALRALGGVAPVTKASGKRTKARATVIMRKACNGRLRNAFYHWARVSAQYDPASKAQYTALRERRHSHGRALRSVADRQLRILVAMLASGTEYDPTRPRRGPPT